MQGDLMTDVLDYLISKNVEYKLSGSEAIITCPECGRKKLYININNGAFHCFYCEAINPNSDYAKGHITTLKQAWGDLIAIDFKPFVAQEENKPDPDFTDQTERYHYDIHSNKRAIKYLLGRGITEESIDRFKLGVTRRYNQDWISIPSYEKGIPKLLKFRKLPPDENPEMDKCIREEGGKSILFNGDAIDKFDEVVVTEGEIDCITLLQNGYENVVGVTVGAGTLKSDWYDQLLTKTKISLIFDADKVGQKAARNVWATRLGIDRCYNVLLPQDEDINSFFMKYDKNMFDEYLKKATRFKVEGIMSLSDALIMLHRQSNGSEIEEKFSTPWESLNDLIGGGIVRKRLTVVGGPAAVGKTTFALQMCYHLATNYEIPCLYFCLEMSETSLAIKTLQLAERSVYQAISPSDGPSYVLKYGHLPIYFGYSARVTLESFYNTVKEARNRYGIGFVVFDNLQLLVRTGEESDIAKASQMFKMMAMDLDIMVCLISQPRKLNGAAEITYDDLKGSSAISQDADTVILIQRKREESSLSKLRMASFSEFANILVDKDRFARGGSTVLHFRGDISCFDEMEKKP